jgi:hypothetical protein
MQNVTFVGKHISYYGIKYSIPYKKWLGFIPILPFADKKDIRFSQIVGPEKHHQRAASDITTWLYSLTIPSENSSILQSCIT